VIIIKEWLILYYKIPSKPTSSRVYVWRKLKRLGAILFMDSNWVLPETSRTLEHFQWLVAEIIELGGEAHLWRSNAIMLDQEENVVAQFIQQTDEAYTQLLVEIQSKAIDLSELSRKYQQIKSQDYFNSNLGVKVRETLLSLRGGDSI
jgi:hypothetical protein